MVRRDGLQSCLASDDQNTWPRDYRLGLAYGLWFDPAGGLTLTVHSLEEGITCVPFAPGRVAGIAAAHCSIQLKRAIRDGQFRPSTGPGLSHRKGAMAMTAYGGKPATCRHG